jgi:uracil-DNA glycosylase
MDKPWGLKYWDSKDWEIVKGKLDGYNIVASSGSNVCGFNPDRSVLFDSLRSQTPETIKVVIVGQDPYPDSRFATGHAFSIPRKYTREEFPASLKFIFKELSEDLAIEYPTHGDLSGWVKQGVLLWNAIPTCAAGVSRSHDWREYHALTIEVLRTVAKQGAVFAFLGAVAKAYVPLAGLVDDPNNPVLATGHPSPRGNINSAQSFSNSRLFSSINNRLVGLALEPIDWRLDARDQLIGSEEVEGDLHLRKSDRVLPNITGASCGPLQDKRGILVRE